MNLAIHGLAGDIQLHRGGSLLDDAFPTLKADFVHGEPAVQPEGVVDAGDPRRRPLGATATPPDWQRQLRLDPALPPPPRAGRPRRLRHGERVADDDDQAARARSARASSAPTSSTASSPCRPALLHDRHPGLPLVPRPRQGVERRARPPRRDAVHRRPPDGPEDQPHPDRADRRGDRADRRDLPRLAGHDGAGEYADEPGFCKSATLDEIEAAGFTLSPGRYVGAPESEEDEIAFEERMATLVDQLADEMAENERLADEVRTALGEVGYEL